jgi:hypothetical protein
MLQKEVRNVGYDVKFYWETEFGASWVLSSWIIRNSEDFPRLTNVYSVDK